MLQGMGGSDGCAHQMALVPQETVLDTGFQLPGLGQMQRSVDVGGPAGKIGRSIACSGRQAELWAEGVAVLQAELESPAAGRGVGLAFAVPGCIAPGIADARAYGILGPAVPVGSAENTGKGGAVRAAEPLIARTGRVVVTAVLQGAHPGQISRPLHLRGLIRALVHVGGIPLALFLVHQAAGIAEVRIGGRKNQGRIQHGAGGVPFLFLAQPFPLAGGHCGRAFLEFPVAGIFLQQGFQADQGRFMIPLVRDQHGLAAQEPRVFGIGHDTQIHIRFRVLGRRTGITQRPVVGRIPVQERFAHGKGARMRSLLHGSTDIGDGDFFVRRHQQLAGGAVLGLFQALGKNLQRLKRLVFFGQQGGIFLRHPGGRVKVHALLQAGGRLTIIAGFAVALGQPADGGMTHFFLHAAPAHRFQRRHGLAVGTIGHKTGSLGHLPAAIRQVDVVCARETGETAFNHLVGAVFPAHPLQHFVFGHGQAGVVAALALAHFLHVQERVFKIAAAHGFTQQVLQRLHAMVLRIHTRVKVVGIGLVFHPGRYFQDPVVERLQFSGRMLGHLRADQGQRTQVTARFHEDVRGLADEGHVAGIVIERRRQVVQGVVQVTVLDEDVGIGQLIVRVIRIQLHHLLQRLLGGGQVSGAAGLLVVALQDFVAVRRYGRVVGINLLQTRQQGIGFLKIPLFLVQVNFPQPQAFPVGIHLQQLIHIADGAGIVAGDFLHVHQEGLGLDMVVSQGTGFHQMVTGLVVVFGIPPVTAAQVLQVGLVRIQFQTLVQQFLALGPTVLGEKGRHLVLVLAGQHTVSQEHRRHRRLRRRHGRRPCHQKQT